MKRLADFAAARAGLLVAFAVTASAAEAAPASDNAIATLCGIVEASAIREGLPVGFFTRLIWRESAFHTQALSPAGAMGVAQFMPGTALDRGLDDPFDPAAAIPASARLIGELAQKFGNLGLAAAAYNAGPAALGNWLSGKGPMPLETQAYVLAITGRSVETWRSPAAPAPAGASPAETCLALIARLQVAGEPGDSGPLASGLFAPWGAQIAASFSKRAALRAFARARHDYAAVIGRMRPFVLGTVLASRGSRPFYRVRLPAQTGAEAERICERLKAAGGACAVMKS